MKIFKFLILSAVGISTCQKTEETGKPVFDNVVVIIADDHSYEVTGCYGNNIIRTPNIDRLADEGILFENAYSNSPICSASRQSLLTGKYPHATGVNLLFTPFNDRINITLAEYLKNKGFRTAAIGKTHFNNWIWAPLYKDGLPRHGFDTLIDRAEYEIYLKNKKVKPIPDSISTWNSKNAGTTAYQKNAVMLPQPCYDADCEGTFLANQAVDYMQKNKDRRFLMWVAFHEPHAPFAFPVEYAGKYKPTDVPLPQGSPEDDRFIPEIFKDLTEEEKRGIIASYYTSVEYMDKNVGIVLDGIDKLGLRERTLVLYLSDQGYLLNNHKRFEKHTMWAPSIKSPLIIRGRDKMPANVRTNALIEFVDIVPTILDGLGVGPMESVQGTSFYQVLRHPDLEHKQYVFAEFLEDNKAMIASKKWKYIFTSGKKDLDMGYQTGNPPAGIYHRLYDLENDPAETTNLAYRTENQDTVKLFEDIMLNTFMNTDPYIEELPLDFTEVGKLVWFCEPRDVGAQPGGYPYRIFERKNQP